MVVAIIQARMGANRLPGKPLMLIKGKPMLWHLIERLRRSKLVDKIIVATTVNPKDKAIVDFADRYSIPVMRGKEEDVLDRFYEAAKKVNACVQSLPRLYATVAGLKKKIEELQKRLGAKQ